MTKEAGRTTVSGPLGDCIVIERGEYLVRDGGRTVRTFSDAATATAYAKAYVGITPEPVTVEIIKEVPAKVAPNPEVVVVEAKPEGKLTVSRPKAEPKTVDTRATLNKKVESRR